MSQTDQTEPAWRNSAYFNELNESQQLRQIYNTTKASPLKPQSSKESISSEDSTMSTRTLNRNWRQIQSYICIKGVIWILIGSIIFWRNFQRQDNLTSSPHRPPYETAQKWCCDCHKYAESQSQLSHQKARRVDWSYCSKCFNCTACNSRVNDIPSQADTSWNEQYCEGTHGIYHKSECHVDYLSATTMTIFYKNYHYYGIGALVTCALYVGITLFIFKLDKNSHHVGTIGMLLMVYNVIVAMICFYMIFKTYQYDKKTINNETGAYCYVDTIGELAEHILEAFVYSSLILVILQWLFCCCKFSQNIFSCL